MRDSVSPVGMDRLRSKKRSKVSEVLWQAPQVTVDSNLPSNKDEMEDSVGMIGLGAATGLSEDVVELPLTRLDPFAWEEFVGAGNGEAEAGVWPLG